MDEDHYSNQVRGEPVNFAAHFIFFVVVILFADAWWSLGFEGAMIMATYLTGPVVLAAILALISSLFARQTT